MTEIGNYTWRAISEHSEFLEIRHAWNNLFTANPQHSPFMAWGWIEAWLKYLAGPHDLNILTMWDDQDTLQMAIPLLNSGITDTFGNPITANICGYGPECSDYLGILRLPRYDNTLSTYASVALGQFVAPHCRIRLTAISPEGQLAPKLCEAVESSTRRGYVSTHWVCPAVELPDTWEEYSQKLSRNFRSQVQRKYRQILKNENITIRTVSTAEASTFASHLIRLNRTRMDDTGKESSLEDEQFRKFLTAATEHMAKSNLAWMDVIEEGDTTIGAALNLVHGTHVYYYMGGFDNSATKLGPGNALFVHIIKRAIENNYSTYDFLRGAEQYKYRWGATDVALQALEVYPLSSIRGRAAWAAESTDRGIRQAIGRLRN